MAKSKVIKDFVKNNINVEVALKQLKVLLCDFDKDEIKNWIDCELQGYKGDNFELPEYRICNGILKGTFLNYNVKASNVAIPLSSNMDEKIRELCSRVEFPQGVAALEDMCNQIQNNEGSIGKQIPPDVLPYIQNYSNISMTCLLSAQIEVSPTAVRNMISNIQNRILDILLLLEKEFGCLDDLDIDFSEKTEESLVILQNNIFNIIVDNHVEIGDENKIVKSHIST